MLIRQVPCVLSDSRIDVELEDHTEWNTQDLAKLSVRTRAEQLLFVDSLLMRNESSHPTRKDCHLGNVKKSA
jgi:hypothetical protein